MGVTQHILGIQAELSGLRIDPCLPEGWDGFQVMRRFRGMNLTIKVVNIDGLATGVSSVTIEGVEVAPFDGGKRGALVPVEAPTDPKAAKRQFPHHHTSPRGASAARPARVPHPAW